MPKTFFAGLAAAALFATGAARADVLENVQMTFASGATFVGQVSFSDDFSQMLAVNGLLSGGDGGYGNDPIGWIWNPAVNFSSGDGNLSNFLLDGPADSYNNFILLAVNASDPTQLQFTTGASFAGADNTVDYGDAMVSGSITAVSQVPEPSRLPLFAAGLAALALVARRKSTQAPRA